MPASTLDVVVFGATGDTGRCCCHFLYNKAQLLNIKSWAPAARNLDKLKEGLGAVISGEGQAPEHGVLSAPAIKADASDYESILAMAKRARVVVACAGPFADYGELVIKACVEAGTDYVDITGETPWVNIMAKKYGAEAKSKGLSMLSQSAYDSVPSDITVALAAAALAAEGETIAAAETHHNLAGGAMPVGTLKTVLKGVLTGRRALLSAVTFGIFGKKPTQDDDKTAANKSKAEADMAQKALLKAVQKRGPEGRKKSRRALPVPGLVPSAAFKAISSDLKSNFLRPFTSMSGTFSLPSFMAAVNTPIVHTTAHTLGYASPSFTYRERLGSNNAGPASLYGLVPFAATMLGLSLAAAVALSVAIPLILLFPEAVTSRVEKFNNSDPGGAKAKAFSKLFDGYQPNGITNVIALASSASGKAFARVTFESDFDAGLGFTALSALTVAGAVLAKRQHNEPGNGFETAVAAVGPAMLSEYFGKVGVRIQTRVSSKL